MQEPCFAVSDNAVANVAGIPNDFVGPIEVGFGIAVGQCFAFAGFVDDNFYGVLLVPRR